jgi:hypothetical protein
MLTDPVEIQIASGAKQKNVRDPKRSREHFVRIFDEFLADVTWADTSVLDMGPGQYDFGVMARERGATVFNVERDPAVVELGRYKGFDVVEGDLKRYGLDLVGRELDGLFCKYSINAFWFLDPEALDEHVAAIDSTLVADGWAWIAPWNGVPKKQDLSPTEIEAVVATQRRAFESRGYTTVELSEEQSRRYGVHGATANRVVFVRGAVATRVP